MTMLSIILVALLLVCSGAVLAVRRRNHRLWLAEQKARQQALDAASASARDSIASAPINIASIMRLAYAAAMRARADGIQPGPALMARAQEEAARCLFYASMGPQPEDCGRQNASSSGR